MFRLIKNDDGIALMMVLVLLILVGGLTAALMSAGVFNIRFGGDEVERTQSLYAADAGVEYMKSWLRNENFDDLEDNKNEDGILFSNINDGWFNIEEDNDDAQFRIKLESNSPVTFISEGRYNNQNTQKIKFSFTSTGGDFEDLSILLRWLEEVGDDIDDYYDFAGNPDKDDTITEDLMDLLDMNHEDEDIGFNDWYSVLDSFGLLDEDRNFLGDNVNEGETFGNDENFVKYTGDIRGNEYIGPDHLDSGKQNNNYSNPFRYYSKDEVNVEVSIGGNITIRDSIIIIDGDLKFHGTPDVKNSLIIVRNGIDFNGANDFGESFIFGYFDTDTTLKKVSGVPATGFTMPSLNLDNDDEYDLPEESKDFIRKLIALYELNKGDGSFAYNSDWRQVR